MGSRKRVKGGKKKGKRWSQHNSCVSNPQEHKFRQEARRNTFQQYGSNTNSGGSGLTADKLKLLDAMSRKPHRSEPGSDCNDFDDSESVFTVAGKSYKTVQSFASDFTSCTNFAFSRFQEKFQPRDAKQREMLAVLAATTEVIKKRGGETTDTEYFCSLIATLESIEEDNGISAILTLLAANMKHVPQPVLQKKFSSTAKTFMKFLAKLAQNEECANNIRLLLGCLSVLLRVQNATVWKDSSTVQIFDAILTFVSHSKPKIRKAAQHAVFAILRGSSLLIDTDCEYHPIAPHTAEFLVAQMERCHAAGRGSSKTTILHLLAAFLELMPCLPKSSLKIVIDCILSTMSSDNVIVTKCCLRCFGALAKTRPSVDVFPADRNSKLVNALYQCEPSPSNTELIATWAETLALVIGNLVETDINLCGGHLPTYFAKVMQCISKNSSAQMQLALSMCMLIDHCVPPVAKSTNGVEISANILAELETGLDYHFHSAWETIIELVGFFFKCVGNDCLKPSLVKCIRKLSEMRESVDIGHRESVDKAIGLAVSSVGLESVLEAIPLKLEPASDNDIYCTNDWLLPLLRDNLQNTRMAIFIETFIPLEQHLQKQLESCSSVVKCKEYELLQKQIWSLLPGFCRGARDILPTFQKRTAQALAKALERPDIRLDVLSALRNIVSTVEGKTEERERVAGYTKNYLPILFNLYLQETPSNTAEERKSQNCEGLKLSVLETISSFVKLASATENSHLFERCFSKLSDGENQVLLIHDLIRCLLPYQNAKGFNMAYDICKPLLLKSSSLQKKGYRLLEEICKAESQVGKEFVKCKLDELRSLLTKSLSSSEPQSKGPRLRCICHIVQQLDTEPIDFIEAVIPEAVLCCREQSSKARAAAYSLLVEIAQAFERWFGSDADAALRRYLKILLNGLTGSPTMRGATTLALAHILYELRNVFPSDLVELLVHNACVLVTDNAREVCKPALSFVKVLFTSADANENIQYLPLCVESIVDMSDSCKRAFRNETRDIFRILIRRYKWENVASLVPETDKILHMRLSALRKDEARHKKKRSEALSRGVSNSAEEIPSKKKGVDALEDTDSEDESAEKSASVKKTRKGEGTLIEEDEDEIVDFLSPKAWKNVTATKSKATDHKPANHGFTKNNDGLWVIDDDSGDESDAGSIASAQSALSKCKISNENGKRKRLASEAGDGEPAMKYKAGGSGIHRPIKSVKSGSGLGEEYRHPKAGGDRKIKGKPDPHVFLPFGSDLLNKRKRSKMAGQLKGLVRGARAGMKRGSKRKKY